MLDFFENIYRDSSGNLLPMLYGPYAWVAWALIFLVGAGLMMGWFAAMAVVWTYGERRIAAFLQGRVGPNRVGPFGLLQPIADGIKLLFKEDVIPQIASRFIYIMAPLLVLVGAFMPFAALPFSERWVIVNMELGLFFVLAFEAVEVIGILMAGWGPGSKWSLYGGMRLAAQMLSYEVPMGLCILVIIILTGSLNFVEIVNWQSQFWIFGWSIFRSPAAFVAFIIFYVGGLASTKRAPFDLPEAESELVAGFHTEYSGMRFAFFFMAEYASMYLICALAVILFLGGWYAPLPLPSVAPEVTFSGRLVEIVQLNGAAWWPSVKAFVLDSQVQRLFAHEAVGALNLVLKSFVLYFLMIWVRWTLPRIRIDQVMYICLKVLLPFALVCVLWTMGQVLL